MKKVSAQKPDCPLCHADGAVRLFESRDRVHNLPGTFTVFQCRRCRAIFYQPVLRPEELSRYYPDTYGRFRRSRALDKKPYKGLRRFVLENYYHYPSSRGKDPSLLKMVTAFPLSLVSARGAIPYRGEGRFLDVGCGGGSYLYRLKRWGWEVYGVEPSESGVRQAQSLGLDVRHGELVDARFPEGFFDVVRLNHVLEHLADPQGTFREIRRVLRTDGVVHITIPNTRSLNFWLFGANWYGLDAPRHVISYCPKALEILCSATGFEIVRIHYRSGAFNFLRSIQYYMEEKGDHWPQWLRRVNYPHNRPVRWTLKPLFFLVDILSLGDIMVATVKESPQVKR